MKAVDAEDDSEDDAEDDAEDLNVPSNSIVSKKSRKARRKEPSRLSPSPLPPTVIKYLLNVMSYEKHVVFETVIPYEVNSTTSKRFFLRSYIGDMSLKAETYANSKMYACHFVDIKATVLWNGIKPHERSSLMLIESWQPIEEVLIHLEDSSIRKKSFAVDLIFNFSRTKDGVIPPDDPIAAATAVATKKLGTATMKLQKEMEERAMLQGMTAERMSELQSLHLCEKRACRNFGQYCWNDETKNQQYPLNSAHFVTWNKALDDGISGVDSRTPPPKIRENLFSLNKGKKKTESSSPKQETSSQEMPFGGGHSIYQHPM